MLRYYNILKGILISLIAVSVMSCSKKQDVLSIIVVAPGHFHASLLQKNALPGVSDTVRVYAQSGSELEAYKSTIDSYNTREDNPTSWVLDIYEGDDFLDHIPSADGSSFAVFAGNNKFKSDYILHCVEKGYHVISDKPMAINAEGYVKLQRAYDLADAKGLVIYDLMTERHDIHHFFKQVSGKPLTRPMWYFDVRQQGEGIADVTTHFIDLILWECFPEEAITVSDVEVTSATRFPTLISLDEYKAVTGADAFPEYLVPDLKDNVLNVYSNGSIGFTVKGIPVNIIMRWDYAPEPGSGDRFHEVIPGSISNIEIIQDSTTGFARKLFINTTEETASITEQKLKKFWPEISLEPVGENRYLVNIPDSYRHPHEEHFNMVGRDFIGCIRNGSVPDWEISNTLTKYHITTTALELAK